MTEQEIFDELCKEFDIESPRLRKVSKAIHQKFLDSLEKTTSDLVDQHLEAEDKLKESHKQALIDQQRINNLVLADKCDELDKICSKHKQTLIDQQALSQCPHCLCMTKNVCGKCGELKY